MTNEEKADEICKRHIFDSNHYDCCMEMTEWKEKQMIDKACEWLKDMACYYAHWECNSDTYENEIVYETEKLIEDFAKAMKGEEQ